MPTTAQAAYIAAAISVLTALLNIAFSAFNTRRQLKIDFEFKKRLAEFDSEVKARNAARTDAQKDSSEIIRALIDAVRALQEYRDAATYVLRNSSFPEILDCSSALEMFDAARKRVENSYSTLSAQVPLDELKPLHSSKHIAVETEAALRSFLHNKKTVPALDKQTEQALSRAIANFAEAQAGLRDRIQSRQLELTKRLFSDDIDSLDR